MTEIPQIRKNVLNALWDLTRRTDREMNVSFSAKAVYQRGRDGNFLGKRVSPLWSKSDEPKTIEQVESELQWIARTGYAESNITYDGESFWNRSYISSYLIKKEKMSEVEEIVRRRK